MAEKAIEAFFDQVQVIWHYVEKYFQEWDQI